MSETRTLDSYAPQTSVTEEELVRAFTSQPIARPCACGGVVVADPLDPTEGVRDHQLTPRHGAWRAWFAWPEDES